MSNLVEKIRRSREANVEAAGFVFTIRRPTDVDMLELRGGGSVSRLFRFVVGWDKVREIDLIPGGAPAPAKFDPEVFAEWVADRPDILGPVVDAIMSSYRKHADELEANLKN